MNLYGMNAAASFIIFAWATWCVLSPRVNDGIVGKFLLSCTALSAFACAVTPTYGLHPVPEVSLNVCLAALAIRHWFVRQFGTALWRRVSTHLHIDRRHCDRRQGGTR